MTDDTKIWTEVDFEEEGKQVGWLHLPYSVTRSAYGTIAMPIAVIRNGPGPTAFLMAGNHGDEYEGQIALAKLIRSLEPGDIRGRVIVLPTANFPAAMAGARVSPLDGGNLNRSFPGDADGGPTKQIAHYIEEVLLPMADFFQDLHSGGSSLQYLPFCSLYVHDDPDRHAEGEALQRAFDAPVGVIWRRMADPGVSVGAARRQGVLALGGEFGGGGTVAIGGVGIVERGIVNVLAHLGILPADRATPSSRPMRKVEVVGRAHYVYAPDAGLFEPFVELGDDVEAGEPCGQVHFMDDPARAPVVCHFKAAGTVFCKRQFGRVVRGDCVAHLASDLAD